MNTLNSSELCAVLGGSNAPNDFQPIIPDNSWSIQLMLDALARQYDEELRRMMLQAAD